MTIFGLRRAAFVRCAPFAVFMVILALRGAAPADGSWGFDVRWLYGAQLVLTGAMLIFWWRDYGELARQTWPSWTEVALAIAVGLLVFGVWIELDAPWMSLSFEPAPPFVPLNNAGQLDWPLIAVRLAGAVLLVPMMEELFWRSFLLRWVQSPQFEALPPAQAGLRAVVISTFLFVLAHTLWLAAIVAGLAYAFLYMRSGKLWTAVLAHAVTNAALGLWVLKTGQWQFW
jgi:uncharacterized protein